MATLSKDVEADAEPVNRLGVSLLSNEATGGATNLVPCDDDGLQRDFVKQIPGRSVNEPQTSSVLSNNCALEENSINYKDSKIPDIQVPTEMKFKHYDILLLNTEEDFKLAKEVKKHLETDKKIVTKDGNRISVLLYTDLLPIFNRRSTCMEIGLKNSTYTFILVTEAFTQCLPSRFLSEECFWNSLNDESKRWCFVSVFTDKRAKVPFGMNSLSGIKYYRQNEFYFSTITNLINKGAYMRLKREEEQKVGIEKYKKAQTKTSQHETTHLLLEKPNEEIDSSLTDLKTCCISNSATEPSETSVLPDVADINVLQKQDFNSRSCTLDNPIRRNEPDGACKQTEPLTQAVQQPICTINVNIGGQASMVNVGDPPVLDSSSCEAQSNRHEFRNEDVFGIVSLLEKSLTIDDAHNLARNMSMTEADISYIKHDNRTNAKACVRQIVISLQRKHGRDFDKKLLAALEDIERLDLKEKIESFIRRSPSEGI